MAPALVLNATYEPISVVTAKRAVVLVLNERADMVAPSGQVFRSARSSVEVPSVVRLRRYVRVPYPRRIAVTRRGVFARDGGRCQYCAARAESIDHVRPRSRGGQHTWENVVASCKPCNTRKRDRLLSETTMRPRTTPRAPSQTAWVTGTVVNIPEPWQEFLSVGRRAESA